MLPLLLIAAAAAAPQGRAFPVTGFDRVTLDAPADVTIASGPFAVRATGDPELVGRMTARVEGGALVIGMRSGASFHGHEGLRVAVTLPRLAGIAIAGAGNIVADRAASQRFDVEVRGAGNVEVRALTAAATRLVTTGAGGITVAGRTGSLYARVGGVGSIKAAGLAARAGDVGVAGTGNIAARVDGPVKVSLTGVGSVDVDGAARCEVHKTGIGSVRCGGQRS